MPPGPIISTGGSAGGRFRFQSAQPPGHFNKSPHAGPHFRVAHGLHQAEEPDLPRAGEVNFPRHFRDQTEDAPLLPFVKSADELGNGAL